MCINEGVLLANIVYLGMFTKEASKGVTDQGRGSMDCIASIDR